MAHRVHWTRAGAVSGSLELAAAFFGAASWYARTMIPMINNASEWALLGRFGRDVTEHQIGGAALVVFFTHPLTWLLIFAFWEGAFRLCGAAFFEDVLGTFPLYLIERTIFLVRHQGELRSDVELRGHMASMLRGVRARTLAARLENVPDQLHYSSQAADEILEICASRPKQDWVPPKVVCVDDRYYRLEDSSLEKGARPFRYRLRRLEAGVPGRNVIIYKTRGAAGKRAEP